MSTYADFESRALQEPPSAPAYDDTPPPHSLQQALRNTGTDSGAARLLAKLAAHPTT
ncbi:hypothetical protein J5O04_02845 [Corynebacterium hindlerae]|uniref:hypothetical protein n=1 Tax=Corynebacterium hindlerae TaxID=699041 RepID=UPI001AD6BD6C|nr:hypothetical protein [Corynebacterium hindlerae]QTH60088.1 hypothetical protein J5O04_02845 [Corynebacterium hindlerae]